MKIKLMLFLLLLANNIFAQELDKNNFPKIVKLFPTANAITFYLYKTDTLLYATYPKKKNTYSDQMGSINYYNTSGKEVYSAKVGGRFGFRPDSTFKKMQSELVKIGTITLAIEKEEPYEDSKYKERIPRRDFKETFGLVYLYTEPNFKGKQLELSVHNNIPLNFANHPIWNNKIRSIQIPEGCKLRVFDIDSLSGDNAEIGNKNLSILEIPDLQKMPTLKSKVWDGKTWKETNKKSTINFDNKISSFQIIFDYNH
jgi:hypothetical protein